MKRLFCALFVVVLPLASFANTEVMANTELHVQYTKQMAGLESYIRGEVEALAVKSAYSSTHPDILGHQRNIRRASEQKIQMTTQFRDGSIKLCKQVFQQ
ncbi:hypothetical protein [Bdellovibrio sp. HCB209]|uniref:hypothetical protein n=1 Tax=Bdellovibrio sp. HCB209 TaxID=3394354 RepID=UPI0039B540FB